MSTKALHRYQPELEVLEDRCVPALIAGEVVPLLPPPPRLTDAPLLQADEVNVLLQRAAAATASDDAIVAVVDRGGNLLGVRVEANVSSAVTGNANVLDFSID